MQSVSKKWQENLCNQTTCKAYNNRVAYKQIYTHAHNICMYICANELVSAGSSNKNYGMVTTHTRYLTGVKQHGHTHTHTHKQVHV